MNPIITPPPAPTEPHATSWARNASLVAIASLRRRALEYRESFQAFWDNRDSTPDEKLEALGTSALPYLTAARTELACIEALAPLAGLTLGELLQPTDYEARREFIPEISDGQPTGRLTLAPPDEGFDAWGVQIVIPEPIPEIEP